MVKKMSCFVVLLLSLSSFCFTFVSAQPNIPVGEEAISAHCIVNGTLVFDPSYNCTIVYDPNYPFIPCNLV